MYLIYCIVVFQHCGSGPYFHYQKNSFPFLINNPMTVVYQKHIRMTNVIYITYSVFNLSTDYCFHQVFMFTTHFNILTILIHLVLKIKNYRVKRKKKQILIFHDEFLFTFGILILLTASDKSVHRIVFRRTVFNRSIVNTNVLFTLFLIIILL